MPPPATPPPAADESAALPRMSLLEHLEELRRRLLRGVAAVAICFVVTYTFHEPLFAWLALPLADHLPEGGRLVFIRLQEPFILYLKVAAVAAILVAAPYLLLQLWLFISPGLYRREKRLAIPFVLFSTSLFLGGVTFAYLVAFPAACAFFIQLGQPYAPTIAISEFFDLAIFIILGMGAVFQLPVVVVFLSLMGLITPGFMVRKFRHAILLIFIVAAVISPTTDAVNLFIFAAPMVLLYVLSIGLCWAIDRRRKRRLETGVPASREP